MKKNPSFSFFFWGTFCVLFLSCHYVLAQTAYSESSDLKQVTLDQELDQAMAKADQSPTPALEIASENKKAARVKPTPKVNLFAQTFMAAPSKKSESIATDVQGFTIVHTPSRKMDAEYAVITDFGGEVVKTRYLKGLKTMDDVNDYIQKYMETAEDGKVEIRKMSLPGEGGQTLFWVGDKAFTNLDEAKQWIARVREQAAASQGDFDAMVAEAQEPVRIENEKVAYFNQSSISNQKREEDLILKWADQMDVGEELWGPLHGDPTGEPILWQSFGETSFRATNLENKRFNSQVGYWANRLVFKGIRFPLNTLDPFIESTVALEGVPEDFKSHATFFAGVEWRPLARNHWLSNYRPIANLPLLEFVKNYRFFFKYGDRKNIKDEIEAKDWDYQTGVQVFYEFGIEMPDLTHPAPENFSDYLKDTVWGEYFSDFHWARTDFSNDIDSRAITIGNSLLLGIKLPAIPLPQNPINNQIVFMPYFHLNQTWNDNHSFSYQNYYYVSAGMRWMPFRDWRHKENEWLYKIKVFGEWIALGKTQYVKEDSTETGERIHSDLRFGVSFASNRY